jgi:hypothetical protein
MEVIHGIGYAALFGAICAIAVYALTYLVIGERANSYPAGAIIPAAVLTPWWAALCAGIAAHVLVVMVCNAIRRRKSHTGLRALLCFAIAGLYVGFSYSTYGQANDVIAAIQQSDAAAWDRVAHSSDAGAFVASNYRPCADATVTVYHAIGWRAMATQESKTDPLVCATATVSLAKQQGGDAFAQNVAHVIERLPDSLALSPQATAALDRVIGG